MQGNNIYFGSEDSRGYLRYEDGKVVLMNYEFFVSGVNTYTVYCNGLYGLGESESFKNDSGGNKFITIMSPIQLYKEKIFTINEGATLAITNEDDFTIGGTKIKEYIKNIIKDSVTISVTSAANDTTVSGGENGVYTVTTTDNTTVSASEDIYCYFRTNPDGATGYKSSAESYSQPSNDYLWTKCTSPKRETKDVSTSGSIQATITVTDD